MFLLKQLLSVELELLALENVTVSTARLAGAGRNGSVQTTSQKLRLQMGIDGRSGLAAGNLANDLYNNVNKHVHKFKKKTIG